MRYLKYIITISFKINGVWLKDVIKALKNDYIIKRVKIKVLISLSRIPNLIFGSVLFKDILVSYPQYITKPQIFPLAKTVFYHIIFSSDSDSF